MKYRADGFDEFDEFYTYLLKARYLRRSKKFDKQVYAKYFCGCILVTLGPKNSQQRLMKPIGDSRLIRDFGVSSEFEGNSAIPKKPSLYLRKNMTTEVKGYQPQTEEKIALVNKFKDLEKQLGDLYKEAQATGLCCPRMLAIGKTEAQTAFMWMNRSVFQPQDFFV